MAHIIGRKQLKEVTTDKDLLHVCVNCHKWLDETVEGIKYKRRLADAK
jgi:predicted HNH restriction endonuclease